MQNVKPLEGLRVAEMASYLSGPYATLMLADMGATVTKIEPPEGDPYRKFGARNNGVGVIWQIVNRDKTLDTIDLKQPEGLARFLDVVRASDVLVLNQRRKALERMGLTADVLREANPDLLVAYVTGYGNDGPMTERPAYDAILQGMTGSVHYQMPGQQVQASPYFLVDKVTAAYVAQAIVAALYGKKNGSRILELDLSMLHIATYFNFPDLMYQTAHVGQEKSWRAPQSVIFATRDGHLILSPVTGRQLSATLDALGLSEHKDAFKAMADKDAMLSGFFKLVRARLLEGNSNDWLKRLEEHDVPCGPVLTAEALLENEQIRANEVIEERDTAWGRMRRVTYPARFWS
ncbi:CoA transferase [Pigmentiphaga sp.]|uniref:CaiB/BaiF CoA transferase family protein n=1 Tax=Pigmentiphaga sp. TaxID=1977564 RepID=UPI0025D1C824|nr:CoA transferase [Pigmentiphaga sp.]